MSEGEGNLKVLNIINRLLPAFNFKVGDYVFATKYSDADPHDRWFVGFISVIENDRLFFHDRYSYRYATLISDAEGIFILQQWSNFK